MNRGKGNGNGYGCFTLHTVSYSLAFEEQLPLHTPLETHGNVYTHGNKC